MDDCLLRKYTETCMLECNKFPIKSCFTQILLIKFQLFQRLGFFFLQILFMKNNKLIMWPANTQRRILYNVINYKIVNNYITLIYYLKYYLAITLSTNIIILLSHKICHLLSNLKWHYLFIALSKRPIWTRVPHIQFNQNVKLSDTNLSLFFI